MATSILITGCSSGIGLCAALMLKKRGYRVFASARSKDDVATLASLGFESILLDVNDSSSIQQAIAHITQLTGGTLDALFNNAGFLQAGAIVDLTREMERAQFETNVFGPMELIRAVLPIMQKQGHGRIIQNSSILGLITMPYYGAYNASKFALEGFSRTLRQELRQTGIYVSILNPGPIKSDLRQNAYHQYQQTIAQTPSDYRQVYQQMEQSYFHLSTTESRLMQPPDAVVKKLIHVLESKHPKLHYPIGFPAQILAFLAKILPDSALEWVLSTISYREGKQ